MESITLEKVDMVRERTGVTYKEAKEALEVSNGDVLEAIIHIEENNENFKKCNNEANSSMSIEELKEWLKDLVDKGNVTRIKIKKDDTELIDIPVNAGIAAGIIAIAIPPILAAGVIAAIATQITIEITKKDGSVEVVNKYVSKVANDFKDMANDFAEKVKTKVNDVKTDVTDAADMKDENNDSNGTVYSYKVTFDKEDDNTEKKDENN